MPFHNKQQQDIAFFAPLLQRNNMTRALPTTSNLDRQEDMDAMVTPSTIESSTITFMSLPLEIRNMIYEAYIDNENLEHGHQVCKELRRKDIDSAKPCDCQLTGKGLWAPFGMNEPSYAHERRTYRAAVPALWKVSHIIGEEAKEVYFSSRICLDLRSLRSTVIAQGILKAWHEVVPANLISMIRVLHINCSFFVGVSPTSADRSCADAPLFRLELRNRGNELQICSLDMIMDEQQNVLDRNLRAAGIPLGRRLTGNDIMIAARESVKLATIWLPAGTHGQYPINQWVLTHLGDEDTAAESVSTSYIDRKKLEGSTAGTHPQYNCRIAEFLVDQRMIRGQR